MSRKSKSRHSSRKSRHLSSKQSVRRKGSTASKVYYVGGYQA